jgi:hypothetical protein
MLSAISLMIEAAGTSKTSVIGYQTTRRNIPKDINLFLCILLLYFLNKIGLYSPPASIIYWPRSPSACNKSLAILDPETSGSTTVPERRSKWPDYKLLNFGGENSWKTRKEV